MHFQWIALLSRLCYEWEVWNNFCHCVYRFSNKITDRLQDERVTRVRLYPVTSSRHKLAVLLTVFVWGKNLSMANRAEKIRKVSCTKPKRGRRNVLRRQISSAKRNEHLIEQSLKRLEDDALWRLPAPEATNRHLRSIIRVRAGVARRLSLIIHLSSSLSLSRSV